ncbi:hypothetical protein ACWDSJ_21570 [Nocardia sp. NPDC003482]
MPSGDTEVIHVSVSSWEYGCCGEVPRVGGMLRARVSAFPAEEGEAFAAPPVLEWDRELEVVRFGVVSARWTGEFGDPEGRAVRLVASWHDQGPVAPDVVADIVEVYRESVLYRLSGGAWRPIGGTAEHTRVPVVERFSESGAFDQPGDGPVRQVCGAVLGLRVRSCAEASAAVVAEYRARRERDARTVHLTAPAATFGPLVPGRGERLTIDLSDPRISLSGRAIRRSGVVSGEVGQASVVSDSGRGWTTLGDIAPGTPADTVDAPLFVALILDPDDPHHPSDRIPR